MNSYADLILNDIEEAMNFAPNAISSPSSSDRSPFLHNLLLEYSRRPLRVLIGCLNILRVFQIAIYEFIHRSDPRSVHNQPNHDRDSRMVPTKN